MKLREGSALTLMLEEVKAGLLGACSGESLDKVGRERDLGAEAVVVTADAAAEGVFGTGWKAGGVAAEGIESEPVAVTVAVKAGAGGKKSVDTVIAGSGHRSGPVVAGMSTEGRSLLKPAVIAVVALGSWDMPRTADTADTADTAGIVPAASVASVAFAVIAVVAVVAVAGIGNSPDTGLVAAGKPGWPRDTDKGMGTAQRSAGPVSNLWEPAAAVENWRQSWR